jgi:hypothetical protein
MRLLRPCVAALLGLVAFPLSGQAQLSPADPFSFYYGYILPNQNRQNLAAQSAEIATLNARTNQQIASLAERYQALDTRMRFEEELDPNSPGIGRFRARPRPVARFDDTRGFFPGRRRGQASNANIARRGR